MRRRLVKNAFSNLGRGSASAILALLLPPILVRHMEPASYAVWVLILQITAYLGYLDFGLQTAVGRCVAFANEKKDPKWRDGIFSTAFTGLMIAAFLGLVGILLAASLAQHVFPSVPASLLPTMRWTMLIVGISVAVGLPASAWNGAFVGLQRFEVPAITTAGGKILSGVGLVWGAITGQSLLFMGLAIAGGNLATYALQFAMLRRIAPEIHFSRELVTRARVRELSEYSVSLTFWSFSMLLINGFDLILVGRFQFNAVTPYSVAATLISFLAGLQTAIFGVIMPHAAELQAKQNSEALGNLLVKATRLGVLLLLATGLPLIVFASPIVRLWIGGQYAQTGGSVLMILVLANMVRLTGTPFASILIGAGQQRLVIFSPLMEGTTNLVFSVVLGFKYGAMGVAWGTLIGAVAAVLANVFYNLPRVRYSIACSPLRYVSEAMAEPALCGAPMLLALPLAMRFKATGMEIIVCACLVSLCACGISILRTGTKGLRPQR